MAKRNMTIQLDEALIRRAKVAAARRGTSVSGLVATQLTELINHDDRYEAARALAADWLRAPKARGGRTWNREELYDRPVLSRG